MKRIILLILLTPLTWAGDNHVHVEQVASGDVDLNVTQIGYDNEVKFSFAHSGNTFNLLQTGNGNSISWVSYWGPGKSWGGDVDGTNNTENVEQSGSIHASRIFGPLFLACEMYGVTKYMSRRIVTLTYVIVQMAYALYGFDRLLIDSVRTKKRYK